MKRLLLIVLLPLIFGGAGYFASKYFLFQPVQSLQPVAVATAPQERLFKMPLGKVTIQVIQPKRILHILINLDVYLAGATAFERLNGAEGRARLRDATIGVVSDLAETTLWFSAGEEEHLSKEDLAKHIALKVNRQVNAVRHVEINEFSFTHSLR